MENTKINVTEDIELGVVSKTIRFPVRLKMQLNGQDSNFHTSIDDMGQIVLTPRHTDVEFIDAHTEWESDDYVMPTDDIRTLDIREFTIEVIADMLIENVDERILADIDAIGQCIIYPQEGNTFVSASINDSLNLTTEEESPENIVVESSEDVAYTFEQVEAELKQITNDFTEDSGEVKCGFNSEKEFGVEILSRYYSTIDVFEDGNWYHIQYANRITESICESYDDHKEIIDRFMMGDIPLFSDDTTPDMNYIHISELDSNGFVYYHDPESDAMVSYAVR